MRKDLKAFVVTGASSGIGRAIADRLVAQGHYVFASVRKPADAQVLNAAFGANGQAVLFDVSDMAAIEAAAKQVGEVLGTKTLSGLVNNAGIALPGPALLQPMAEIEQVMNINFMGVVRCCRAFAPLLGADPARTGPKGRILNITSVSGKFGYPFTAAYVAAKHAVEGFSDSLRRELLLVGIDVIVVGPGAVKTPIWEKGAEAGGRRYAETIWGKPLERLTKSLAAMDEEGLEAEIVADVVEKALTIPHPKTRYAPVPNKLVNWWLARLLPARIIDRIIGKNLSLLP
ncbi:SDR family oxidoreductase [Candidatus Phycosocius spiralis]|uniref:Short-chain dehydrogenase/reductase n=1 Tax=Candidatus Phycosocius spiralis TaxID=2815099 RepID=A0ABQ4PW24_9PROT|nr:SDR family oxidoreductase [Candidatus Phycosocius spiralis]GIU66873.1 short-chain dehydrogenase/reductase [Candidatus Phycosocius spiralis]